MSIKHMRSTHQARPRAWLLISRRMLVCPSTPMDSGIPTDTEVLVTGNIWRRAKIKILAALFFLAAALPAFGQTFFWKDGHGKPVPDTPSQKSVNGVGAWLLVTSDEDWEAKWNTPSETIPQFTQASTVTLGKHVFILSFVANPTRSKEGDVNVTCDFEIERPNHVITHQNDIECLKGKPLGSEGTLYLTKQIVGFVGDNEDPKGKWIVRITIKDLNRPVSIPLETSFTLQ